MKNKRGIHKENLTWLIFFIVVLSLALIAVMLFTGTGKSALDYIKNLFRFGT